MGREKFLAGHGDLRGSLDAETHSTVWEHAVYCDDDVVADENPLSLLARDNEHDGNSFC